MCVHPHIDAESWRGRGRDFVTVPPTSPHLPLLRIAFEDTCAARDDMALVLMRGRTALEEPLSRGVSAPPAPPPVGATASESLFARLRASEDLLAAISTELESPAICLDGLFITRHGLALLSDISSARVKSNQANRGGGVRGGSRNRQKDEKEVHVCWIFGSLVSMTNLARC